MDAIVVKRASLQDSDYVRDLYLQARRFRPSDPIRGPGPEEPAESVEGHDIVLVAVQCLRGVLHYWGYAQLAPCIAEQGEGWRLKELFVLPEAEPGRVEQVLLAAVTKYAKRKDVKELLTDSKLSAVNPYPYAGNA